MNNLNVSCTFVVTKHCLERCRERTRYKIKNWGVMSKVLRIIELGILDQDSQMTNLEKFTHIYNEWKNTKQNYKHEGKCIILFEEENDIYKLSCGINILINQNSEIHIILTCTTFMNVLNSAFKYKEDLKKLKLNSIKDNMYISIRKHNIYLIPDIKIVS